jgi:hypothetical protein
MGSTNFGGAYASALVSAAPANSKTVRGIGGCAMASD